MIQALLGSAPAGIGRSDGAGDPMGTGFDAALTEAMEARGAVAEPGSATERPSPRPPAVAVTRADRDVSRLDPELRSRLERLMRRMREEHGHEVTLVEGYRSSARQDHLFAQGRTRPGSVVTWTRASRHEEGRAADLLVDGSYDNADAYARLQTIAQEEGLRTLGPMDPGHVELAAAAMAPNGPIRPGEPVAVRAEAAHGAAPEAELARAAAADAESTARRGAARLAAVARVAAPAALRVASVARVARVGVPGAEAGSTTGAPPASANGQAPAATPAPSPDRAAEARVIESLLADMVPVAEEPLAQGVGGAGSGGQAARARLTELSDVLGDVTCLRETLARSAARETAARSPASPAAVVGGASETLSTERAAARPAGPLGTPVIGWEDGAPVLAASDGAAAGEDGERRDPEPEGGRIEAVASNAGRAGSTGTRTDRAMAAEAVARVDAPAREPGVGGATAVERPTAAARIEGIDALRDRQDAQPVHRVTLRVGEGDDAARVRVDLRGDRVSTDVRTESARLGEALARERPELTRSLRLHGLEPESVLVRRPMADLAAESPLARSTWQAPRVEASQTSYRSENNGQDRADRDDRGRARRDRSEEGNE